MATIFLSRTAFSSAKFTASKTWRTSASHPPWFSPSRLHTGGSSFSLSKMSNMPRLMGVATAGGTLCLGLGLASMSTPVVHCDAVARSPPPQPAAAIPPEYPPPPQSSLSLYELSFGTVCGICTGVFIKKGAKAVAFLLGGVFVILQYFGSLSLIRVNWTRAQSGFESLFYTTEANGVRKPPTLYSLWNWLVNFLVADFPPRASFVAGMVLGLRIG